MNKALLIGIPVVIIGGALWYYPQYQAPKAHEIIETQLAQLQTNLRSSESGDLTVIKHETSKTESQLELEWTLQTSSEMQALNFPETITFLTKADIELNTLPSMKGFKAINSSTHSPDLDKLLKEQGSEDGLTLDCKTMPTSVGLDTDCSTNEVVLKNTAATGKDGINSIAFAKTNANFNIDQDQQNASIDFQLPHIKLNTQDETVSTIEQISIRGSGPYDLEKGSIKEHLSGFVVIDGESKAAFSIGKLQASPNDTEQQIQIDGIQVESTGSTDEGLSSVDMQMTVGEIKGFDYEVAGAKYSMKINNFLSSTMAKFNLLLDDSMNSSATQALTPEQIETAKKLAIEMLAVGPALSQEFKLDQAKGTVLSISSNTAFKANTPEHIEKVIEKISSTQIANPMALLPLVLENITLKLDAQIKQSLAQEIAMFTASTRPQDPAMTKEQQEQAAAQSIAMLEMMSIVKKVDDSYSSSFTLDDQGIMLNGKDMAPLLGLPPQ